MRYAWMFLIFSGGTFAAGILSALNLAPAAQIFIYLLGVAVGYAVIAVGSAR